MALTSCANSMLQIYKYEAVLFGLLAGNFDMSIAKGFK